MNRPRPHAARWSSAELLAWIEDGHDGLTPAELRAHTHQDVKTMSNRLMTLRKTGLLRADRQRRHWLTAGPARPLAVAEGPADRRLSTLDGELGVTVNQVVNALVQLRWPEQIPTVKFADILDWRDHTERLLA